ncbi:MAG: hypothetical protein FJ020_08690 [Chloroflexi bacterium]|nr:hypothetical protein [Chloroflexota bacterium]
MAKEMSLKEVLEGAIEKEIEAQRLYTGLSRRVKDEEARHALEGLAREEKGHQKRLEGYLEGRLSGGTLSTKQAVDYKIAEMAGKAEPSEDMGLKETFLLAANREKASHALYTGLAGMHPPGEARRVLLDLAAQEMEHKQRVESLYTQVAFPQTDGG